MSRLIESHGITNCVLGWDAWLDVVQLADASAEQVAVLEESHPKAKESDYYLFLVHQHEAASVHLNQCDAVFLLHDMPHCLSPSPVAPLAGEDSARAGAMQPLPPAESLPQQSLGLACGSSNSAQASTISCSP